jgi:hypothetical protein
VSTNPVGICFAIAEKKTWLTMATTNGNRDDGHGYHGILLEFRTLGIRNCKSKAAEHSFAPNKPMRRSRSFLQVLIQTLSEGVEVAPKIKMHCWEFGEMSVRRSWGTNCACETCPWPAHLFRAACPGAPTGKTMGTGMVHKEGEKGEGDRGGAYHNISAQTHFPRLQPGAYHRELANLPTSPNLCSGPHFSP